jgi:anti-anti-sigma factor
VSLRLLEHCGTGGYMAANPTFERTDVDGVRTLLLRGEVDLAVRDEFRDQLERLVGEAHSLVCVDLSETTFFDSSALGVLVAGRKHADGMGVPITLRSPQGTVRLVLEISGVDEYFEIDEAT